MGGAVGNGETGRVILGIEQQQFAECRPMPATTSPRPLSNCRHIGFAKTGSTFLQHELFPRLAVQVPSDETSIGRPRTCFADWRERLDRFEGRAVIVIRRQPEILESYYKHAVLKGYAGSLHSLIGLAPLAGSTARRDYATDWRAFDYTPIIAGYVDRLGAENVLVLPYEFLRADLIGFCSRIAEFVGTPLPPIEPRQHNVGANKATLLALRLRNYYGLQCNSSIGYRLAGGAVTVAKALSPLLPPSRPMDDKLKQQIFEHYRQSNRDLMKFIRLSNLKKYNYF